jgi:hypothetical protein
VAYASYAAYNASGIVPPYPSHIERLTALAGAATSPDGVPEPALVPTYLYVIAKYATLKALPPSVRPPPRTDDAPLEAAAFLRAVLEGWLLPLLPAVATVPALRGLLHEQTARFFLWACETKALEPAAAEAYVRRAIESLAPGAAGGDGAELPPVLRATLAAVPHLEPLLGSLVSPVALAWAAPDFEPARAIYVRVAMAHLKGFDWAVVGLAPHGVGYAGPGPTPSPGGPTPFTPFALATPVTPATPGESGDDGGSTTSGGGVGMASGARP